MLRLDNIRIKEELNNKELLEKACKKYNIKKEEVIDFHIYKKSIDARKKDDISYVYSLNVEVKNEDKYSKLKKEILELKSEEEAIYVKRTSKLKPVIVGSGPAGLFCALYLIKEGIKPIIIEQGKKVEERIEDVKLFREKGILNTSSNVHFGEGGAGTFSDGKLTSGINNLNCRKVLSDFVKFGAPEEIEYVNKPHIGTDKLVEVVKNIREYLISQGTEIYFNEKFIGFESNKKGITAAITNKRTIETDCIVLAIGHSARSTFEMLYSKNIKMEAKNFSVGVRVEHKQELINDSQYGKNPKLKLPPAEYKLVYHNEKNGRSCYTFCMCPGGVVIASSSEEGTIVTNGMSTFARDGENANSAILVNVGPSDFKGKSPLKGMYFQKEIETKAFELGGRNYNAPYQRMRDFLENKDENEEINIVPTYKPGVTKANLNELFPDFVTNTLKEGIKYFDTKLKGFASDEAILIAPETRSSSPVKIPRRENGMSESVNGLYPCGEGPGYAGGIMSAAVDGIKIALKILQE